MSKNSFGSFFGGTMGVLIALVFVFFGLPILFCGGCLMLGVVGSAVTSTDSNSDTPWEAAPNTTEAPAEPDGSVPESPSTTAGSAPTSSEATDSTTGRKEKLYGMKETANVGYTTYAVWRAWWSDRLSDNEFLDQSPDAAYLFVELTVRNDDKKARMVAPFKLIDDSGNEYQPSSNAWAVEGSIGLLKTLNPDVSKQGFIVFDVPKGRNYKLKVSGGFWSAEDALFQITTDQELAAEKAAETTEDEARRRDKERELEAAREAERARLEVERKRLAEEKAERERKKKQRTWTSGTFTVEAELIKRTGDIIFLKRLENGKEMKISIDKLSAEDQAFIRERKWED